MLSTDQCDRLKGTMSGLKCVFMIMVKRLLYAYFTILKHQGEKITRSDESKEKLTKEINKQLKKLKFNRNGSFDFLTKNIKYIYPRGKKPNWQKQLKMDQL